MQSRNLDYNLGAVGRILIPYRNWTTLEVQQNTGIPVRTGVSRAYLYGSAVRYVPVHSGAF